MLFISVLLYVVLQMASLKLSLLLIIIDVLMGCTCY